MDFHPEDCDCKDCDSFRKWADDRLARAKQRREERAVSIITDDDSHFSIERAEAKAIEDLKIERMQKNQGVMESDPSAPSANELFEMFAL